MIITTTDPITGEEIRNPQFKPYVIEGTGHLAVKIHFESEETRRQYLARAGGEPATGSYRARIARVRTRPDHAGVISRNPRPADTAEGGLPGAMP